MTTTPADEIAAEIWAIRRFAQRILPGDHAKPHVFPEQMLELTERLDALHTRVRDTFGGAPPVSPGVIRGSNGRRVVVERRTAR